MKSRQSHDAAHREPAAQTMQRARTVSRRAAISTQDMQAAGKPNRKKPPDAVLQRFLAACITTKKGNYRETTTAVLHALSNLVGDTGKTGTELITWITDEGTARMDTANHTAATATWEDGTYVIDTTCGQFGGQDFFVGSVAEWRQYILGLAATAHRITRATFRSSPQTFGTGEMRQIALALKREATPRAKRGIVLAAPLPPSGGTPPKNTPDPIPTATGTAAPTVTPDHVPLQPRDHR